MLKRREIDLTLFVFLFRCGVQVQLQMEVCNIDQTIFCQYKPSKITRGAPFMDLVVIERDRSWFADNIHKLHSFWKDYMAAKETYVPPAPIPTTIVDGLYDL